MPFKSISRRWLTLALCFIFGFGVFSYTAQAIFPGSFWRIVQIAERLSFLYGGVDNPVEYLSIENDGRVGIGTIPTNGSAILELKSEDRALLVSRVNSVGNIATPENGMIAYEIANSCFKVYQNDEWSECLGTSRGIRVLPQEPTDGEIGDVYYNTTNNTLFIHNGDRFVAVTANFLELVGYNHNCSRHALVDPNLQLRCPNNKQITSLFYETATFSNTVDNHSIPEITAVECCQTTYHPFYWHTTDWGTCVGNSQTRTVTCRDINDNVVDASLCIGAHQPPATQDCDIPEVPNSWRAGSFGACSTSGIQTRVVECIDGSGNVLSDDQCDAALRPAETQNCTPPVNCNEVFIGDNHPLTPFVNDGRVVVSGQTATFTDASHITNFVKSIQSFGLTGAGQTGIESGINSTNLQNSATAQAVCREAGFNRVVGGIEQDAFDSPSDNTLYYWTGTQFATTNAKHPTSGIRRDRKIERLVCGDPFGISVHPSCPGNGGGGGGGTGGSGPSDNLSCNQNGIFEIPHAEFDGVDGSANAFLGGGNHAFIDWNRCDRQVTAASVDNGGIRINFINPPRTGTVELTVNTGHARIYRVAHAGNITGNLPSRFESNRSYVYTCNYNGANYSCGVR